MEQVRPVVWKFKSSLSLLDRDVDGWRGTYKPELIADGVGDKGYGGVALVDGNRLSHRGFMERGRNDVRRMWGTNVRVRDGYGASVRESDLVVVARNEQGLSQSVFGLQDLIGGRNRVLAVEDVITEELLADTVVLVEHADEGMREYLEHDRVFWGINEMSRPTGDIWDEKVIAAPGIGQLNDRRPVRRFVNEIGRRNGNWQVGGVLPTSDEFVARFAHWPDSVGRGRELAEEVDVFAYPRLGFPRAKEVPYGWDSSDYLAALMGKMMNFDSREVVSRVGSELELMRTAEWADMLLVMMEIREWAASEGIELHPSGSVNNSKVAELLGVSEAWRAEELSLERILSEVRVNRPDGDLLVSPRMRPRVVEYLGAEYGAEPILVVNRWRRQGVRRVNADWNLGMSNRELDDVVGAELPKNVSRHPTGVLLGDEVIPHYLIGETEVKQVDKDEAEWGFKLDLPVSYAVDVVQHVRDILGEEIVIEEDEAVIREILDGKTTEMSGPGTPHWQRWAKEVSEIVENPTLDDVALVEGLVRPGAVEARKVVVNQEDWWQGDEDLERLVGRTRGGLVFQGQLMDLGMLAGLSAVEVQRLRKSMSGGNPNEGATLIEKLREGVMNRWPGVAGQRLLDQAEGFVDYTFVEGHARSLAGLVYEQAYLRSRFPKEYWRSVMVSQSERDGGGTYIEQMLLNEMRRNGVDWEFLSLDELDVRSKVGENGVVPGLQMLRPLQGQGELPGMYSQLKRMIDSGVAKEDLIRFQMERLGKCFTHNSVELWDSMYQFYDEEPYQKVRGQVMMMGRNRSDNRDVGFLTLDCGEVVQVVVDWGRLRRELPEGFDRSGKERLTGRFVEMSISNRDLVSEYWRVEGMGGLLGLREM